MKKKFLLLGLVATILGGCGPISVGILTTGTEVLLLEEYFKI